MAWGLLSRKREGNEANTAWVMGDNHHYSEAVKWDNSIDRLSCS
jgi:hypothetical protein